MRISSSDGSVPRPASDGIETFGFRAGTLFVPVGAADFRVTDGRRGVFLDLVPRDDPPASGGPPPISAWTILFFFGTD